MYMHSGNIYYSCLPESLDSNQVNIPNLAAQREYMSKPSSKKKVSKKASGSGSLLTKGLAAAAAGLLLNQHAHAEDTRQSVGEAREPALADEQLNAETEAVQVAEAEVQSGAGGQELISDEAELSASVQVEEVAASLKLAGPQFLEEGSLNGLQLAQVESAAATTATASTAATAAAEATAAAGGAAAATAVAAPALSALSIAGLAAAGVGIAAAAGGGGSSGGSAPTAAPTPAPTASPTPAPTASPTPAPTASPTPAPTASPTPAPTASPTPAPTASPTPAPTASPTPAPTASPTPAPTASPTPAPTASPTPAPTASPTPAPTASPTPAPTASPTPAPAVVTAGKVVDGNVEGAKVFYDANNNGVFDSGEASGVTLADGTYTLSPYTATANGKIVVEAGGIDSFTGQKVGMMFTGAGMSGVNPLAMLLAASPGVSQADMLASLGLTGLDLNHYDPMADMLDPSKAAAAQKAFTVSQQVFAAVQAAAAFSAKNGGGAVNMADIAKVAKAVADTVASGGSLQDAVGAAVNAALGDNPSADALASAASLKAAINTINAGIETAYANLAAALQSGDPDAIANAVAAAAMSQNALLSAANGDAGALDALSDSTKLAALADLYKMSADTSTFTVDFDKVEKLSAKGLHFHKDANVTLNQMSTAHLAGVLALTNLSEFGIDHLDSNESTVNLTDDDAATLISAGIDFVAGDFVEMTAQHTELHNSFKELQALGVDSVKLGAGVHGLHIALGNGADLSAAAPVFAADANVTLDINADQLDDVLAHASQLGNSHIDHIDVQSTALLEISEQNAADLIGAGISFAADDNISLTVAGTHISSSFHELDALGVDSIKAAGGVSGLHIGLGAGALAAGAAPVFADSLDVTLDVGASQLASVLAHTDVLHNSHIDHIDVTGAGMANISVDDAQALLDAGVSFAANDHVTLTVEGTSIGFTHDQLSHLGVDAILHNGVLTALGAEDPMHATTLQGAGHDLQAFSFAADPQSDSASSEDVSVHADNLAADDGTVASEASLNTEQANVSADSEQPVAATSDTAVAAVSMSDLQMAAMLVDGQAIAEDSTADITIHAAGVDDSGVADLAVSLADLAEAGVDHVESDGNTHEIIVDLGIELTNDSSANDELHQLLTQFTNGEPVFAAEDHVQVNLGEHFDVNIVDESVLAELKLLGIDDVLGEDMDHDGHPDSKPIV
jgi:hypothetical protein